MAMLKLKKINSDYDDLIDIHEKTSVGRELDNDIVIDSYEISRHHCLITIDEDKKVFIKDLNSLNGTFINNQKINKVQVEQYDVLQIGDESYVFINTENNKQANEKNNSENHIKSIILHKYSKEKIDGITMRLTKGDSKEYQCPSNSIYTIGRLQFSDIAIEDESVSRTHATVDVRENYVVLTDSNSTNGTFVNKKEITQKILKDGDIVGIGESNIIIIFNKDENEYFYSLKKDTNKITIDLLKDYENLLAIYNSEYNRSLLLEVERQSLIFYQEFEQYYKTINNEISRQKSIVKFISLISKSMLVVDASTLKKLTEENGDVEKLDVDYIQQISNTVLERGEGKVIYLEDIESDDSSRIHMNAISAMISNQIHVLILGIPFSNILYLIYVLSWMSRSNVDANETI